LDKAAALIRRAYSPCGNHSVDVGDVQSGPRQAKSGRKGRNHRVVSGAVKILGALIVVIVATASVGFLSANRDSEQLRGTIDRSRSIAGKLSGHLEREREWQW